jgi:dihydropteroate synthase
MVSKRVFKSPQIVVTLNTTPDSFSDSGQYFTVRDAQKAIASFVEQEVDVIDIGGESTRPGAISISADEEWDRIKDIIPLALSISQGTKTKISLDSRKYESLLKAADLGVDIFNDVSCCADKRIISLLKEYDVEIILMHSLTVPADRSITIPAKIDPINYISSRLRLITDQLIAEGIKSERIIIDPGVGFGNTPSQAVQILKNISSLKELGYRVLIGHSRKSLFNLVTDLPFAERDLETHILTTFLALNEVDMIRVHDLSGTKRALLCAELFF